jgi:MoxR-like ATPase
MNMRESAGLSTEFPATHLSRIAQLESAVSSVIRGKDDVVRLAVACLLARGHLLIEDVPGVGKTTLAHALARAVSCEFHRLQCTTDMLPSDILGVSIYNARSGEFEFKRGPVFTNFLLADEINRATPKTQSALLEAMNEGQVTVDGRTWPLDKPFMVIATQNPVEHHGTYPLPESQLDRFLMRVRIGYPDLASEKQIVRSSDPAAAEHVAPVVSREEVTMLQSATAAVAVDEALVDYIMAFVEKTRRHPSLVLGVSPRGAQMIYRAAQAMATVEGRDYVVPDDVKRVILPVCTHRVTLDRRASVMPRSSDTVDRLLAEILTEIDVPL